MTRKKTAPKKHASPHRKPAKKQTATATQPALSDSTRTTGLEPTFPVVGVGASAGGLEAFRELLKYLPNDTGMAFVLIQHLDPTHESLLPQLLEQCSEMPVYEAQDNMQLQPNQIYVIPPDSNMGILHDTLQLIPRQTDGSRFLPVDWFMRTLAEDKANYAIGVVLSGTASDGTLGLQAIKSAGGFTLAQSEESAEYFDMPGNAIAAGCVDFVLTPQKIAREITKIARHPYMLNQNDTEGMAEAGDQLNKIFLILRSRTSHDFTYYKHTTIKRRIKRRMMVHKLDRIKDYIRLLERDPNEVQALFDDILINVTSFFRDPDSFASLQKNVFPKLLDKRPADTPLRIWVAGCSSGEEAYSIAMALFEYLDSQASNIQVQIFATDIDEHAIDKARLGVYPEQIVEDIDAGRLKRFFIKVPGGYQVNRTIRDMCVFALQNVTKDPPFSKIDLISCRNLLIYLGSILQQKLLGIFHFSLQPSGFMMLGTSETIGNHADLFRLVDKKNKIYAKKTMATRVGYEFDPYPTVLHKPNVAAIPPPPGEQALFNLNNEVEKLVLDKYGPPGVVVNHDLNILHFRGETGPYLNPAPGSASLNLLKMARAELAVELRASVHKAGKENKPVRKEGIRLQINGSERIIDLQVMPLPSPIAEERCLLILFEQVEQKQDAAVGKQVAKATAAEKSRILELEQEIATNRDYMQSIIEDLEAGNEELKSANEEIQSTNEELQSTNEEMETAKEELQSTNEELATVNEELENRNTDISAANNDLTNLQANINLPILMLGQDLRIRHFTQQAEKLLNLIETDIGRPIGQIRSNIEIPDLERVVSEVIDTMATRSFELQDRNGHWYNIRIRPYKTLDHRIEGAVITFIDIDSIKDAERLRSMQRELERMAAIVHDANDAIIVQDFKGNIEAWNPAAERIYGWNEAEALQMNIRDIIPGDELETMLNIGKQVEKGIDVEPVRVRRLTKSGEIINIILTTSLLLNENNQPRAVATTEKQIDKRNSS